MNRLTTLALAAVLVASAALASAQTAYNFPPAPTYAEAVIGFRDLSRASVTGLRIDGDSLSYRRARRAEVVHADEVAYIRVRSGSNLGAGIGIGAAVGLGIGLQAALPDDPADGVAPGPVIAVVTALGAGIGALVGGFTPRRRTYYLHAAPAP